MTPSVAVLTGAGISTSTGIPDFRGPGGLWTRSPEKVRLLDIDVFVADRDARVEGWRDWAAHPAWTAAPSAAHRALASVPGLAVLTQNFDGLHQAAGTAASDVVELHGTLVTTSCLTCGETYVTATVVARLASEPDPRCDGCGGILKPDIVYFGEALSEADLERADRAARTCDLFVAVGTTLQVYPVAALAGTAVRAGAELVIVNASPTAYDAQAARVIREPIDQAVPALVEELGG
ncbi:Sir2 family NAD-dependent protein deacetylase [Demequina sp. SYSU T00068]|uniref:SIR2 family NAD-dependent protein deacylase n=1 Tax=Demequina lignilytica TaxID=3051663 RepID=UPI00261EFE2C|nr:Sir2 family NAD-dependent protein deacetylase [Demequina sp. SYSU T00068]MDN4489929.1 Sir2 family NAD-dependent protein deacetylase [Demequina sp. SYSU T00068]